MLKIESKNADAILRAVDRTKKEKAMAKNVDLLTYIRDHPDCSQSEIVKHFGGVNSASSHRLKRLISKGEITSRKEGRFVKYRITKNGLRKLNSP